MKNPTKSTTWLNLQTHSQTMAKQPLRHLFATDDQRFQCFSLQAAGIFLDYSKNHLNAETLKLLFKLAQEQGLVEKIEALFTGQPLNGSENRAVLHTALRTPADQPIWVNGEDVSGEITHTLEKMQYISASINNGEWRGYSNKAFTDVVNIGIGGSDQGPAMAVAALTPFRTSNLRFHFVANVDGNEISSILAQINPETTLFIVSSKSFTTKETLYNANTAQQWLNNSLANIGEKATVAECLQKHFIAITAYPERAEAFGLSSSHILQLWDWVGGRYSVWSAVGLPIMLAIGADHFKQFLAGAHAMDQHFRHTELQQNMPVILALLGIWYINFFNVKSHAILPYDSLLQLFIPYLQQAEMESNGKDVQCDGSAVDYATAPIIWGGVGCNGQHAFHQLLHQGTQLITADFLMPVIPHHSLHNHHLLLLANCFSQTQALMQGKNYAEAYVELVSNGMSDTLAAQLAPHKVIPGNRPSNTLLFKQLTPETLGALIALYEHKIFVQGVIWNINSFDQWGVELGKQLSERILIDLTSSPSSAHDASTTGLIDYARASFNN
ncbi:glucose-6-phosphate isomerase [soil metagenome]